VQRGTGCAVLGGGERGGKKKRGRTIPMGGESKREGYPPCPITPKKREKNESLPRPYLQRRFPGRGEKKRTPGLCLPQLPKRTRKKREGNREESSLNTKKREGERRKGGKGSKEGKRANCEQSRPALRRKKGKEGRQGKVEARVGSPHQGGGKKKTLWGGEENRNGITKGKKRGDGPLAVKGQGETSRSLPPLPGRERGDKKGRSSKEKKTGKKRTSHLVSS